MTNQEDFDGEKQRQHRLKEVERAKRFFLKKGNLFVTILVVFILIFLAFKYGHNSSEDFNKVINYENKQNIAEEGSVPKKESTFEKDEYDNNEKRKLVLEAFGDHQITFAGQDLKLKGFFNPEDDVMSVYYANDILISRPEHELAIYQYNNKISLLELFNQEELRQVENSYLPKYIKTDYHYNDSKDYFLASSYYYEDYSVGVLSLIKIFENDGRAYKIIYTKHIKEDVLNTVKAWVESDYKKLVDEFNGINVFTEIDLDYVNQIFDDNLRIKNELSGNNLYKEIKWDVKTVKEDNAYARINLEYPEFKGFTFASGLNKIIRDIILGTLEKDRKIMEEWKLDEKNSYIDDDGNLVSDCYGEKEYYYNCSVALHSSFKVKSIINNVISIEMILTDYTGGGNGNHSYVKSIMYDLKNGKQLFLDNLFCNDDYLNKIKGLLRTNLITATGQIFDNSLDYLTDEVLLSYLREASFNDLGLTLSFDPYIFTSGAYGIYNVFIPYSLLENDLCFNGYNNN